MIDRSLVRFQVNTITWAPSLCKQCPGTRAEWISTRPIPGMKHKRLQLPVIVGKAKEHTSVSMCMYTAAIGPLINPATLFREGWGSILPCVISLWNKMCASTPLSVIHFYPLILYWKNPACAGAWANSFNSALFNYCCFPMYPHFDLLEYKKWNFKCGY